MTERPYLGGDAGRYNSLPRAAVLHGPAPAAPAQALLACIAQWMEASSTLASARCFRGITMKTQSDYIAHAPRKAVTRALLLGAWVVAGMLSTAAIADNNQDEEEQHNGSVVRTVEGPVRGIVKIEASTRTEVHEFLGIPYAAPPVGKLRWMHPEPVTHWG